MADGTETLSRAGETNGVITKACDFCRKRKIRCQPTAGKCAQCTRAKRTDCHYTPISMKRKNRQPPGYKHISKLEERLKNMETLLKDTLESKAAEQIDFSHAENLRSMRDSSFQRILGGGWSETDLQSSLDATAETSQQDMGLFVDSLEASASHASRFLGSEQASSNLAPLHASSTSEGGLALGPLSLPTFHPLPPKHVALGLVEEAFTSFNDFFPLFDKQDFLQDFEQKYAGSSPGEPGWWACVNTVLSLAHRFRAMRTLKSTPDENAQSCAHMQNALAVVSELTLLKSSLPAVQALVGMATILQGTPNPHAASTLTAAALRLAQGMGLHRKSQDPSLTSMQHEQRGRVFWIAFFLDKDISLRTGLPFAQDDDDMDADLPSTTPLDIALHDTGLTFNIFHARIGLAVIQGQIYKKLYSVQAQHQSAGHRAAAAQELNTLLSYWRSNVPIHFEDAGPLLPGQHPPVQFFHMLILRFTYVHCLTMIDRHLPAQLSEQLPFDIAVDGQGGIYEAPPESICIIESRKAISLIQVAPRGDYAFVWLLLHPFFATVTVLLNNVLNNPVAPQAQSDLHVVEPFLRLLETLAGNGTGCSGSDEAKRMHKTCSELNGRAKEAVEGMDMIMSIGFG